jgi:hypothetical protein
MDLILAGTPFESPFDRLTVPSKVEGLTAPSEIEGGNRRGGPPFRDPVREAFRRLGHCADQEAMSLHGEREIEEPSRT